jgi:hypothetical protein
MKALTPAALTRGDGSLRLLRFAFPQANAVHHPGRHSDPNHAIRPIVAFSVASAPSVIQGFALIQQARHGFTPKQVRAPTDWQFASSCSPRRLSVTQLLSATKSRLTLTGTFTLLTKRPHGRTGLPGQARQRRGGATRSHTLDAIRGLDPRIHPTSQIRPWPPPVGGLSEVDGSSLQPSLDQQHRPRCRIQ